MFKQLKQPEFIDGHGWFVGTDEASDEDYYLRDDGKIYDTTYCHIINKFSGYFESFNAASRQRSKYYEKHGKPDMYPADDLIDDIGSRPLDLEE